MQIVKFGLKAAADNGIKSISLPVLSTGQQGNNPNEMTKALLKACRNFALSQSNQVRVNIFGLPGAGHYS